MLGLPEAAGHVLAKLAENEEHKLKIVLPNCVGRCSRCGVIKTFSHDHDDAAASTMTNKGQATGLQRSTCCCVTWGKQRSDDWVVRTQIKERL